LTPFSSALAGLPAASCTTTWRLSSSEANEGSI
jgi:hypothetical protein